MKLRSLRCSALAALAFACTAPSLAATWEYETTDFPPKSFLGEDDVARAKRRAWWSHDRFGMFIHFGLYSLLGRHEWVKSTEIIPDEEYDQFLPQFYNPNLFDAKEWAKAAKAAGMKYVVLTARHHEGFAMWDTKLSDYKITNTPFKRDLVREYVEAMRAEGLKVGLYFSIIDWHHPDYKLDYTHPKYRKLKQDYADLNDPKFVEAIRKENATRDMTRYRKFMFGQVEELLTNYGKIDIIWFDYTPKAAKNINMPREFGKTWRDWDAVELVKLAHRLQPGILIDNRLDLLDSDDGWDFVTPEQYKVQSAPMNRGKYVPWETCQTFSGSWGYYRDEKTWKSPEQLVELLTDTVSFGGNLILNVGPTGRGEFDGRAKDRLAAMAKWMHYNSDAIYGCAAAPKGFIAPNGTSLTYNKATNRLYIHLNDYPMGFLPCNFWEKIKYAQFLHDASQVKVSEPRQTHSQGGGTEINYGGILLPMEKPEGMIAPVVECFLK